jgi:hypothetical protein
MGKKTAAKSSKRAGPVKVAKEIKILFDQVESKSLTLKQAATLWSTVAYGKAGTWPDTM